MMGPRGRAAIVLLFVFALGAFTGIVYERHRSSPSAAAMSAKEAHEAAMADLRESLQLDDDQVAQIHAIFVKHHDVVQRSWERLRPEVQSAMQQVHLEIAEMLRPDQRERFHEWLMRRREQDEHGNRQILHER
ncbi:MAG TPA: hypothetical protein VLK65_09475 [Vicinamibacteria bacterium]|nr:hypothetical protein [Vicinamibacteria bacterium]